MWSRSAGCRPKPQAFDGQFVKFMTLDGQKWRPSITHLIELD